MIELLFEFGGDIILVVINGKNIKFGHTGYGAQLVDISGLRLDYAGVCRTFPDLENSPNWEVEAVERFKEHINSLNTEDDVCNYIIEELEGCGYKIKSKRRDGYRPIQF